MASAAPGSYATLAWGTGLGVLAVHTGVDEDSRTALTLMEVGGAVGALVPGPAGRAAALLALAASAYGLLLEPSWEAGAVAIVVALTVLAARRAATDLTALRVLARSRRNERASAFLDDRAAVELTRARRHERPLSVVRLSLPDGSVAGGKPLADAAHELGGHLRMTDAIGVTSDRAIILLLPETPRQVMPDLMSRLERLVVQAADAEFEVGWASFPDDAVTWDSLTSAAALRAKPAIAARSQGHARPLEHDQGWVEHEFVD